MRSNYFSFLLMGLALLLLSFTIGCGQSQPEAETVTPSSTATDEPTSSPEPEPARFVLGELVITPTAVNAGEVITISIDVSNTGGIEWSYTVVFKVKRVGGWTHMDNVEVTLKGDQTETVTFTTTKNEWGTYEVNVNGKVGQFTVGEPQVIRDLAYIRASAMPYTDDADPEYDGIALGISFYDSKSESISFQNIPIKLTIELYGYRGPLYMIEENRELIYQKQLTIDHPIRLSYGLAGLEDYIRIPFEKIAVDQNKYDSLGYLKVTVTTPKQGDFEYSGDFVRLYAE